MEEEYVMTSEEAAALAGSHNLPKIPIKSCPMWYELLDDWVEGRPEGWGYEAVLTKYNVKVSWWHQSTSDGTTFNELPPEDCGWGFTDSSGAIFIGRTTETIARKAAALFTELWNRRISASFCAKLMEGYVSWLENQENKRLTYLATPHKGSSWQSYFNLTRYNHTCNVRLPTYQMQKMLEYLGTPADDEEIIVTFTRRKK